MGFRARTRMSPRFLAQATEQIVTVFPGRTHMWQGEHGFWGGVEEEVEMLVLIREVLSKPLSQLNTACGSLQQRFLASQSFMHVGQVNQ